MSELYDLPDGWEWKKLANITEIITKGTTPTTNGYKFLDKGINFLKIENIINEKISLDSIEKFISHEVHEAQKRSQLKENDVLFTIAGTIGTTAIVKKEFLPMNINQAIALIRPKKEIDSLFLKNMLLSAVSQKVKNRQRGGAIKNISLADIKDLDIPLPPLQIQQKIVSKLDRLFEKIDNAIALLQKNIDDTNNLLGSVLDEVFGEMEEKYSMSKFNELCAKITDGSHNPPKGIEKSSFLMLSSKNIFNNSINFNNPRYLKEEDFSKENRRTDIEKGDVLLTIVGTVGRSAVVAGEAKFTLQRSVAVLKPKRDILHSYFLMYFLQKESNTLMREAKGSAQKGIYLGTVKEIQIPLPPLKTQQKTVEYLDKISQHIEKLKKEQKEKLDSLIALKASILDKAFKGKLV